MVPAQTISVVESTVRANGLALHVYTVGERSDSRADVVICHGFLDCASSFLPVARLLAAEGRRVFLFDWRGQGRSEWIGPGGYYHFFDYAADLDDLTDQLGVGGNDPGRRFDLVGHSMGGVAGTYFAGARPERIRRFTIIEGTGMAGSLHEETPDRMRGWLDQLANFRRRPDAAKRMPSFAHAAEKLRESHPFLDAAAADRYARELAVAADDGTVRWRWDPLHRTRGPYPFFDETWRAFADRIGCPVLIVEGAASEFMQVRDFLEQRYAHFRNRRVVSIADAGHMVHMQRPDALAGEIGAFLSAPAASLGEEETAS